MERICSHGLKIGQCSCTANCCSKCGGEKDAEGWCRNYCKDDAKEQKEQSLILPPDVDDEDDDVHLFI